MTRHQKRVDDLVRVKSAGGFGLSPDAPQLRDETAKLERATAERDRLNALDEIRSAKWNVIARLERSTVEWLTRGGIPAHCSIEAVDDPPLGDLMTKAELNGGGANFAAVIERHRMRLRELAADAHRVLSSPYPSKDAKAKARAQIEAIAEASAPDVDGLVEHLSPIMFATKNMQSQVYNVETPAIAFHEVEDGLGFMIWLHRDQVIARVEKEIDGCSDDKAALCEIQRSEMAATINADTLEVHRRICALIWHAEQQHGQTLDFATAGSAAWHQACCRAARAARARIITGLRLRYFSWRAMR